MRVEDETSASSGESSRTSLDAKDQGSKDRSSTMSLSGPPRPAPPKVLPATTEQSTVCAPTECLSRVS